MEGTPVAYTQARHTLSTAHTHTPLKSGQILQMVMGPTDANWPNAISRNSMGKPAATKHTRYGMRKAPAATLED